MFSAVEYNRAPGAGSYDLWKNVIPHNASLVHIGYLHTAEIVLKQQHKQKQENIEMSGNHQLQYAKKTWRGTSMSLFYKCITK